MFHIVKGDSLGLVDVGSFIDLINEPPAELRNFFDPSEDIFVTRAPGRLDVMGGIADYSGSLVLEMPIAEATLAAVQRRDDATIKIVSLSGDSEKTFSFEMDLTDLEVDGYEAAKDRFARDPSAHWASYVAGVFFVLRSELNADFRSGARILISSQIPIGKGVSSSAALEVAAMQAICAAFDIEIQPLRLALLCQKVENSIVGAPCGVMDQITAHCGVENSLLSLVCQPAKIRDPVHIPSDIEFWGIDSGVRHAVAGSDYASVRIGAFMGYRIIADLARLKAGVLGEGLVEIEDSRWGGYLANVTPVEYENEFSLGVPVSIQGSDFIEKYGGTTDTVTKVDPSKAYAVKAPTEHAIYENFRVNAFFKLLKAEIGDESLDDLGELMFQSHASYAACGLTESGTDRLIELVRENRTKGVCGARITGGGSGGTVAIVARRNSRDAISKIAAQYGHETGREPYIFHGSSPGCSTFGHLRLRHTKNSSWTNS
ncbi:MAG: galactokinase family protein [Acidobacteriota bacterium]